MGLHQQLETMTTRHAGAMESTDGVCSRVLVLFFSFLFFFHKPEPGERVIHQAKALCCLGGPVTDPITLIGPRWEAGPPDYMDISAWLAPLRLDLNWTKPKQ